MQEKRAEVSVRGRGRRRSAHAPAAPLAKVVNPAEHCINLSGQGGALTAGVLESVRQFTKFNNLYSHLVLSHNTIRGGEVGMLCVLLKDHPFFKSVDLSYCDIDENAFCFYLGPTLTTMPVLTHLNLSGNLSLADKSGPVLAEVIRSTNLEALYLNDTSLSQAGGTAIVGAMDDTTSLVTCELPFTVGFKALDAVHVFTQRNKGYHRMLLNATKFYSTLRLSTNELTSQLNAFAVHQKSCIPTTLSSPSLELPATSPERRKFEDYFRRGRKSELQDDLARPTSSHHLRQGIPLSPPSQQLSSLRTPLAASGGSLGAVQLWDWADCAINKALLSLHQLDHQTALLRQHKESKQLRLQDQMEPRLKRCTIAAPSCQLPPL